MKHRLAIALGVILLPVILAAQESSGPRSQDASRELLSMIPTAMQTPEMRWLNQSGPVHSLLYAGEEYRGHPTEVFAFYASPATLGDRESNVKLPPDAKFPGVVLIHGGGGTAFAEWVWLWAKRGYAAIAMDLSGNRPIDPIYDPDTGEPVPFQAFTASTRTRLPNGGPDQGESEKFDTIGGDVSDDWPFHAVASVVRAHSLLRSFPEVDADRTAVTGISWGGYTTCIVASLDDRFKAAVTVYGCGYLFVGESVQKPLIDKLAERRLDWVRAYDPSRVLSRCRVPILFVNGSNDVHYPLDSFQKSFDLIPGTKQMRIEITFSHSEPEGWATQEVGLFIDSYCLDGTPLPMLGTPEIARGRVRVAHNSRLPIKSAQLHYTTSTGYRWGRSWQTLPATVEGNFIEAPAPPDDANTWFISITDERDAMTTTSVQWKR